MTDSDEKVVRYKQKETKQKLSKLLRDDSSSNGGTKKQKHKKKQQLKNSSTFSSKQKSQISQKTRQNSHSDRSKENISSLNQSHIESI